ncbi:MAG: membrane protein insertion efficiency factor YidD [Halieaceae bacterium]|nr:membrane protein insertion efficiency factor YidD [Halieaceae bacterium]
MNCDVSEDYHDRTPGALARILLLLIAAYRLLLSPWLGQQCRFLPTCSCYAEEAIHRHGALRGSLLTLKRLSRCHPWHAGGLDPVPTDSRDNY